jgi:hypothetical protein
LQKTRQKVVSIRLDRRLTIIEKEHIISALLERIVTFEKPWKEQDACIEFINSRTRK